MQQNEVQVLEALVPRLVRDLRKVVPKEPYEPALNKRVELAAAEEHLSAEAQIALREQVEVAFRALSMEEATTKRSATGSSLGKFSGRIPRRSTPDQRRDIISGKDHAAGEKDED